MTHIGCIGPGCPICVKLALPGHAAARSHLMGVQRVRTVPRKSMACPHRGAETRREPCVSCAGHTDAKVFSCTLHGECTMFERPIAGVRACGGCPDLPANQPKYAPPTVRNLLYHVYPVTGNGVWQWNVAQLLRRISLFNGRRIVAIATDGRTDSAAAVKAAFAGAVTEFIELPNNPALGEAATFIDMLEGVESSGPGEVTFYGHAKGVTSTSFAAEGVRQWAEAMYELNLDYWPAVERLLADHPVAGAFKRPIRPWPESASDWHFSGSMHWFRNAELFRSDWRKIDGFYGGIEAYPSLHFSREEAGNLFFEFTREGDKTLYEAANWRKEIGPALVKWRTENRADYAPLSVDAAQSEQATIDDFHRLYYDRGLARKGTWTSTFWRGVPVEKSPLDLWIYQELIHELKPTLIIETGTAHGGSAFFLADMLSLATAGEVISIDNAPREPLPRHVRVTYLRGDSVDREIVKQVHAAAATHERVMVILDSDHAQAHVIAELRAYAPLVTPGSYLVVEDTNIGGHPVNPAFGAGPMEAVEKFLLENDGFKTDMTREKFMMTFNPRGWLCRR